MMENLVLLTVFCFVLWAVSSIGCAVTRDWQAAGLAWLLGYFALFFGALTLLKWMGQ